MGTTVSLHNACVRCGHTDKWNNGRCRHCTPKPKGYGKRISDPGIGARFKHGLSYTPEYRAWQTMRLRCTDPSNAAYPDYGGRGITVCDRWRNDPTAFYADMGPKPTPAHELDRINNDGPYSPDNCRWTTRKKNSRNRRSTHLLTHDGKTQSAAAWAEQVGLPVQTIYGRLRLGWSDERVITTPHRNTLPRSKRSAPKNPCRECGAPTRGTRCRPCENKNRAIRRREAGQLPVASKLTPEAVLAIRHAAASGVIYAVLAEQYGVSKGAVQLAVQGLTWRNVGGPTRPPQKRAVQP